MGRGELTKEGKARMAIVSIARKQQGPIYPSDRRAKRGDRNWRGV